ncbi:MAG: sugar phosphate nucleotidyltransferase [Candidatus Aenigmatarchaeota archaeon]
MKERISVTVDKEFVEKIDRIVDGHTIKNRSHALELLLLRAFGDNCPRKALILCGGKGTRLRPITYEIPKALMPIKGKAMLEHLFDLLKKYGITDIILSVGHMKEKIRNHFGDGLKFGVKITYVEEDEPLGTAGPIKLAKNHLNGPFIVSNGDELKNINIEEMFRLHKNNDALATLALTTVEEPGNYGVVKLDGTNILEFMEKPKKIESNLINAGFYILEPDVIKMIPDGFSSLEKDVFPKIAKRNKLFGYPFSGQWFDIGNIERYEKAIKEWKGVI